MSQGLFLPLSWMCLQHPTAAFCVSQVGGLHQDPMAWCCGLKESSSLLLTGLQGPGLALLPGGASDSVEQAGKFPV